jgi:hypothetical protein
VVDSLAFRERDPVGRLTGGPPFSANRSTRRFAAGAGESSELGCAPVLLSRGGRLIFLDETWTTTAMTHRYAWAEVGARALGHAPNGHWKTTTFLSGLTCEGLIAPFVLDGPINAECFFAYVEQILVPVLREGDTENVHRAIALALPTFEIGLTLGLFELALPVWANVIASAVTRTLLCPALPNLIRHLVIVDKQTDEAAQTALELDVVGRSYNGLNDVIVHRVHETMLDPSERDHSLAALREVAQMGAMWLLNLDGGLGEVEVTAVVQFKARRVLHNLP